LDHARLHPHAPGGLVLGGADPLRRGRLPVGRLRLDADAAGDRGARRLPGAAGAPASAGLRERGRRGSGLALRAVAHAPDAPDDRGAARAGSRRPGRRRAGGRCAMTLGRIPGTPEKLPRRGYFGEYGGTFVPETLVAALHELEAAYE